MPIMRWRPGWIRAHLKILYRSFDYLLCQDVPSDKKYSNENNETLPVVFEWKTVLVWEHTIPTCVLNATYFVPYHVLLFALISIFSSLCAWLWIEFVTWNVASTLEWSARCMFRPVAELIVYFPSAKTRPLYIKTGYERCLNSIN